MHPIIHHPEKSIFALVEDGIEAQITYTIRDSRVILLHTIVPDQLAGRGIASRLAHHVLSFLKKEQIRAVVRCPFILHYLRKHPEHQSVIDAAYSRQYKQLHGGESS